MSIEKAQCIRYIAPGSLLCMERVMGIEPTTSAWKAEVLPVNYTRIKDFRLRT
jgi:hypothetical protein